MEKSNKNDDEKKESFLKKHWENIKKVTSTLYFIGIYFIIFYLLLGDLNFSVLKDCILSVIFTIIGFIFAWLSGCDYLKKENIHRFIINLTFSTEFLFVLIILGYLLEKISGINYFLIIIFIILYLLKKYKKKYIKILHSKVGLSLFFIAFSMIINIFGFELLNGFLLYVKKSVFESKNTVHIMVFSLLLYVIISLIWLVFLYFLKNKRSDKKTGFRFILDLIFIIEVFIVFLLMINLLYTKLDKIKFYICLDRELWFFILSIFSICYILNSTIKNIWKINYSFIFSLVFFTFLSGSISIEKFLIVTLIVSIVNIFFSDIIFLYKNSYRSINKNNNLNYDSIIENRTKEKNSSRKLLFNIGIFILYIYLIIIENDRLGLLQFLANILNIPVFNVVALPTSASLYCFENTIKESKFMLFFNEFTKISYIGILRIILIIIILLILVLLLAIWLIINKCCNKSSFGKEYYEFINKIKTNYMNFIRKFIYYKKYVDIKKHKSIKTNIKTSIHINSRKKSHRLYKYKNIVFHNKKPNSN